MSNIILIDTSYIFHRVTACYTWCNKAKKDFNDDNIYNNFLSSINKLSKKVDVNIENMILCRDSRPVWRDKIYKDYKKNRVYSDFGPRIKKLYKRIKKLFNVVIRIPKAEADDIISILTFHYLQQNTKNHIYIISNDKDFYQLPSLMGSQRIHLLNNSDFKEHDYYGFKLEEKILKGDPSDNIKKLKKDYTTLEYLKNKQLIDLSYTPRYIQDDIFKLGYLPLNSNTKPLPIQLGFACINTELREKGIFCSRTARLNTFKVKGVEYIKDLIRENIRDLEEHVQWNYENGIRFMRISSDMMPHYTNLSAPEYNFNFVRKDLERIGRLARLYKQRLTFHPGQYNVLSTPSEDVFQSTHRDLKMHADILDAMGMDQDSVMIIHGGGVYGDKDSAIERFIKNFKRLDENVRRRLVLENCEKCYNIEDVLYISDKIKIPIVLDTHHYDCYNINKGCHLKEVRKYMPDILKTWTRRNIKPKFHISEQRPDSRIGAHSDYVQVIPKYLLEIPEKYGIDIDIMIEAKMKERSVFRLYELYPELSPF